MSNTAKSRGGAIYSINSNIRMINSCYFFNNSAKSGGAIFYEHSSNDIMLPMINKCFFEQNKAIEQGGGIAFSLAKREIIYNEVFHENDFAKNEAIYGINYASYPIKMKAEIFDNYDRKLLEENFQNRIVKLNINSGIRFPFKIKITLEDHFQQKVHLNMAK